MLDFKARKLAVYPEVQPVCRRVCIAADVVADDSWEEALVAQGGFGFCGAECVQCGCQS